jgi:hypothetical protein
MEANLPPTPTPTAVAVTSVLGEPAGLKTMAIIESLVLPEHQYIVLPQPACLRLF